MPQKRRRAFDIRRNDQKITDYRLRHGVDPGITLGRLLPSLVPLYEEREAMVYSHYNPTEWKGLGHEEKAMCVAHYRLSRMVRNHSEDAVIEKAERDARQAQFRESLRR